MTATAELNQVTTLTPNAWEYVRKLLDQGAHISAVPVTQDVDANLFTELVKKKIVERTGQKKGRGGSRGQIKVLIDEDAFQRVTKSAPRATRTPSSGGSAEHPRKLRLEDSVSKTEFNQFKHSVIVLLHDHELLRQYLAEGHSRNLFDSRVSQPLGKDELMAIINSGTGNIQAEVEKALRRKHLTYADFLREEKGYPSLLIELLGEPEATQDRVDEKVLPPASGGNGLLTPPSPMRKRAPSAAPQKAAK